MLRRLYHEQPESFAFTPANQAWAEAQVTKYPEGRQASAVIPLLWRAQEQEGWVTKPAIEYIAEMLDMAYIRVLEVCSFYFMFQMQPVGSVAHLQICGTTSCMICGAEDLIAVCKEKIAKNPHELSADGRFSWEEVECLGACTNAPMAQIGKDYFEDLTADGLASMIDAMAAGEVPTPGPQNGRFAAEPLAGLTSLKEFDSGQTQYNASAALATELGDSLKRIDGSEVPLTTPWIGKDGTVAGRDAADAPPKAPEAPVPVAKQVAAKKKAAKPSKAAKSEKTTEKQPETLKSAREGGADDLKKISGVGPKLEQTLNELGFYHFDQIAEWGEAEKSWVDSRLKFKGRIDRDDWVQQARELATKGKEHS
ncbi:NADH-quinone oxidoreductase subunit E [Cognatishimia activa]|uniref:NADH-quinone oxidoreductase chain 2 n=1 Tax=Cognatishimia activa TaxID=1715691 RepID=A0A0P1IPG6_9RHOB|nr:NADH-quinone oxidoreductase subunit E [Cognatishimia activa]CUJ21746.1 NADH-quinone oxidoreductase chain 2 [Cognatishimia activa]CUK25452.1 NADH-quinone oxidoreductase chain 2 [Cognatishimia activa]